MEQDAPPAQIYVRIAARQKDNRFYLANTAGNVAYVKSGSFKPATGTTASAPQNIGSLGVGSSAAPDLYFNAYWAGEWLWRYTMSVAGILWNNFNNVQIRGFANSISGYIDSHSCPSSCSWGPYNQVLLDANAGLQTQGRVMHEMGHIASYVTHTWHITNGTDDSWGGHAGWGITSAEWGTLGFEESWATHYGSITLWADNSETPTTCNTTGTCYDSLGVPFAGHDLEASSYPYTVNNCNYDPSNPEPRWPLSHMRYFWDLFDNHNDADGDGYSANQSGDFWKHLHNLAWYANGTETDQIDEPWNANYTALSEPDGRGSTAYQDNYSVNIVNTGLLRVRQLPAAVMLRLGTSRSAMP